MSEDWGNDTLVKAPASQPSGDWGNDPLVSTERTAAPPATGSKPDYTGWDTAQPRPTPAAIADVPLKDDPNKTYGTVLPFSKDKTTGKIELAVPEILRAPIRGVAEGGQEARGLRPVDEPASRTDILSAASVLGGARGAPDVSAPPTPASSVRPAALEARQAGYVLPPASISEKPGIVSNALAGWSGKIKTQQAASAQNQTVTNDLATGALGLPKGTVLTDEVFNQVRQQAGQSYKAVIDAIPTIKTDQAFKDIVEDLGGQNSHAAKAFPKITNNPGIKELVDELKNADEHPTTAWVEVVKELRFNANSNLKAMGDPSKHALGLAQREAANAVDDMMERQISASGQPGVIAAYQQARRLIAKAYDVEGVTNSATGDVNARGLAKLADKGRPLTDQLKTIANAASAFPKAMQSPSGFGDNEPWSALDFFGAAGATLHGNPGIAAAIMGRPLARATILSQPYQNMMTRMPTQPAPPMQVLPLPIPGQDDVRGATNGMQ